MNAWRKKVDKEQLEARYLPAALEALAQFPVSPQDVTAVEISENVTFKVRSRDGDYSLRLHRPGYNSIEELNSERAWTRALNQSGISVPDALRTHDGLNYALVEMPGARDHCFAGVTHWIPGTALRQLLDGITDTDERQRLFGQIGGIAARMHNQACSWQEPPGFTRRRLDTDAFLGEAPVWGRFWEHAELKPAERALLLQKRQGIAEQLDRYGKHADNFSLIHADIDPGNLILHEGELSLIDFDDSGYGWHLFDLAPPLDEVLTAPDRDALQTAMLDGYLEHRSLTQADIDMIPIFLLVRGLSLIGWYHQRPEHKDSDYLEEVKSWVLETLAK